MLAFEHLRHSRTGPSVSRALGRSRPLLRLLCHLLTSPRLARPQVQPAHRDVAQVWWKRPEDQCVAVEVGGWFTFIHVLGVNFMSCFDRVHVFHLSGALGVWAGSWASGSPWPGKSSSNQKLGLFQRIRTGWSSMSSGWFFLLNPDKMMLNSVCSPCLPWS